MSLDEAEAEDLEDLEEEEDVEEDVEDGLGIVPDDVGFGAGAAQRVGSQALW